MSIDPATFEQLLQLIEAGVHRSLGRYLDPAPGHRQFDILSPATNVSIDATGMVLDTDVAATIAPYTSEAFTRNTQGLVLYGVAVGTADGSSPVYRFFCQGDEVFKTDHLVTANGFTEIFPIRVLAKKGPVRISVNATTPSGIAVVGAQARIYGWWLDCGPYQAGRVGFE